MKERRYLLEQMNPKAKEQLVSLFFSSFTFPTETIIGAYWPFNSEFDTRPLLHALLNKGFTCALPCLTAQEFIFRTWDTHTPLEKGNFNILEPSAAHSLIVVPSVLLIPLLAFDRKGHRLGYGQGHYDRYLSTHKVLKIGISFQGQETPSLPFQAHDVPLNYILTETELIPCQGVDNSHTALHT